MIGSTVLNTFLLRHQISRNVAFFGTLCGFAFINFILLSMWDNKSNRGEDNEGAEICFSKEKFGFESNHHSTQQSWQQRQQQEFRQQQKREDGRMGWVTETSKFLKMPRTRKKMDKIANFARGGAQLLSRISSCSPPKSLNYPASLAACSSSSLRSDAVMNDDKISCAKRSSGSILFTCCNVTIDAKTGKDELLRFVHCTGKKTNIL